MAAEIDLTIDLRLDGEHPWDKYEEPIMEAMNGYGSYGISVGQPFIDIPCEQAPALLERLSRISGLEIIRIEVSHYKTS